jgi:hypothetical protein
MQIAGIGWIAQHSKHLAASRRRTLPRHPLLQRRGVNAAVSRRDLKGQFDQPAIDRRKRQLFGMNDSRGAGAQGANTIAAAITGFMTISLGPQAVVIPSGGHIFKPRLKAIADARFRHQ